MKKTIPILTIALINIGVLNLTGCTAGFGKPSAGSPTMAEAYTAASKGESTFYKQEDQEKSVGKQYQNKINLPDINKYQQGSAAEFSSVINSQFPKIPNPQNLIYIFGHYAANGEIPVPGHFITFSMYEKDHYALPDEIQKPYNDGQFVR